MRTLLWILGLLFVIAVASTAFFAWYMGAIPRMQTAQNPPVVQPPVSRAPATSPPAPKPPTTQAPAGTATQTRTPPVTKPPAPPPEPPAPPAEPPPLPAVGKLPALLHKANLQYVGGFRVPNYYDGKGEMSYGGTALAFNPANNSLFIVGHGDYSAQPLAEISIPASVVDNADLNKLPKAKVLQNWKDVVGNLPKKLVGANDGSLIGGLMVHDGHLIGTQYAYYSGANDQVTSHFVLDSLDLSKGSVKGLHKVGKVGARLLSGYMTPIPSEWQAALGAPCLTGASDMPIINSTSSGPAAFGFDPKDLGSDAAPATTYIYYPVDHPLAPYEGPANPLQNGNTSITGVVFVPKTNSVLYFGKTGTNANGYGLREDYGDRFDGGKGPHSLNGEYTFQVWAYDANDFVLAKKGKLKPWEVQPYDVWNFTVPTADTFQLGGAAYDAATGRLYVSALDADHVEFRSSLPVFHVFQMKSEPDPATKSVAPEVGTLAATPSTMKPGPVPVGTKFTLTAGNVYNINPGGKVKEVRFYLDSAKGKLLGTGKQSTVANASHNWSLTIPTTEMSAGTYTIVAQADDGGGLVSEPISTTLTIK